jgi:hypothetical protein
MHNNSDVLDEASNLKRKKERKRDKISLDCGQIKRTVLNEL